MLEVQHLYRSFRTIPAVVDVSFRVGAGEIVGFLGPNGAGKSTTVKIITGMLRPDDGKVLFEGRNIRDDMEGYRAVLGYVPEEAHLYAYLSGLEYLQLVGRLRGMKEALIEAKATELLKLLHLESWQYSPISSYSKGMRQRVLIAAALLHDPKLLIFDEPLSGLDVISALQRLAGNAGGARKGRLVHLACAGDGGAGVQSGDRDRQGTAAGGCGSRGIEVAEGAAESGERFFAAC
jgi:ABC-2 type transport system ATP-binding protein